MKHFPFNILYDSKCFMQHFVQVKLDGQKCFMKHFVHVKLDDSKCFMKHFVYATWHGTKCVMIWAATGKSYVIAKLRWSKMLHEAFYTCQVWWSKMRLYRSSWMIKKSILYLTFWMIQNASWSILYHTFCIVQNTKWAWSFSILDYTKMSLRINAVPWRGCRNLT